MERVSRWADASLPRVRARARSRSVHVLAFMRVGAWRGGRANAGSRTRSRARCAPGHGGECQAGRSGADEAADAMRLGACGERCLSGRSCVDGAAERTWRCAMPIGAWRGTGQARADGQGGVAARYGETRTIVAPLAPGSLSRYAVEADVEHRQEPSHPLQSQPGRQTSFQAGDRGLGDTGESCKVLLAQPPQSPSQPDGLANGNQLRFHSLTGATHAVHATSKACFD